MTRTVPGPRRTDLHRQNGGTVARCRWQRFSCRPSAPTRTWPARRAEGDGARNTQSSTLPLVTLISSANIPPRICELMFGSGAGPPDNAARYLVSCTSTGTPRSAITPQGLDPGDPVALATSGLAAFLVGPTVTPNA